MVCPQHLVCGTGTTLSCTHDLLTPFPYRKRIPVPVHHNVGPVGLDMAAKYKHLVVLAIPSVSHIIKHWAPHNWYTRWSNHKFILPPLPTAPRWPYKQEPLGWFTEDAGTQREAVAP